MANTYTQLYIQLVFATKFRESSILPDWKKGLYKFITSVFQTRGHKMLQINGMPDHIHILIGWNPDQSLAEIVKVVKGESTKWIKLERGLASNFAWQSGYSAFSYSREDLNRVINYIKNQEIHHQKVSFLDEYKKLLNEFGIEANDKYLFVKPQ